MMPMALPAETVVCWNPDSWAATACMRAGSAPSSSAMEATMSRAWAGAAQESGFQHTTVSAGNAIGIMQVTPRSGRWASDIVGRGLDLLDIEDNIVAGTVILGWLIETADSEEEALAGYYQDLRSVRADGLLAETKAFVRTVQLQRQRLQEAL